MKDRLWEINHGFEWPEPDEAKVSSPVPRGVGLSDGPRLPDLSGDRRNNKEEPWASLEQIQSRLQG